MSHAFRLHRIALAAATALCTVPALATGFQWNGGVFVPGVTAPDPMDAPDTLTIGGGSAKSFVNTNWTNNSGSVDWLTETISGVSAGVTNNGLWTAQSNLNSFVWAAGSRPTFTHSGEFRIANAALQIQMGNWAFVSNGGTFNAQAGIMQFNGGVATFNAGTSFVGGGLVRTTNDATFSGAFKSDNLQFLGGTATGVNAVLQGGTATTGLVSWDSGTLSGQWTVGAGTTLSGDLGGNKQLLNATLLNQGTARWTQGLNGGSSTFTNQGVFEASGSTGLAWNVGSRPLFVNTGTVRALDGATLSNFGFDIVSNGGTFEARAGGSIWFRSNVQHFNAGTVFSGAGLNVVFGDASFVGDYTASNLQLLGGAHTGGDGSVGSKVVAHGVTQWVGGSNLSGAWELAADHVLTGSDGGPKQLFNANVTNLGTLRWATTNALIGGSSSFSNLGLFEATASTGLVWNVGNRPSLVNSPGATVRASGGATLSNISFSFVNNGGTLLADAGSSIVYGGPENRFNAGTTFAGTGQHVVAGTARFVDAYTASGNLELRSGSFIGGDGTLGSLATAQGSTRWTGGQINGNWAWAPGHTMTAGSGDPKQLLNATLVNAGSLLWNSTDQLLGASSTLTNLGLFEAQESTTLTWNVGNRPLLVNAASGTLRAAAGKTLSNGSFGLVNDGGRLEADLGGAIVYNGGNNRFNDDTVFAGAGSNVVNSNALFVGQYRSANLLIQAGTATGGDGMAGSRATAHGTTTWTGGTMAGSWNLAADHTLAASGATGKQWLNADVANGGTLRWQDNSALLIGSSTFTNNGSVDASGDATLTWNVGAQGVVVNNGLFVKSAGAGETSLVNIALTNAGTMAVRSGSIRLPNNWSNAGTLRGSGTFVTNSLTNAGHLQPGGSIGTLTIAGNYAQTAGGFFDVEVTGLTSHDLLEVSGSVALGGGVAVVCAGNCVFSAGDEIEVLDYTGSRTGSFAFTTLAGFASGSFVPIYDDANTRVLLRVLQATAPVPEPGSWALLLGGLAAVAARWRRRRPAVA